MKVIKLEWVLLVVAAAALVGLFFISGIPGLSMLAIIDASLFVALKRLKVLR